MEDKAGKSMEEYLFDCYSNLAGDGVNSFIDYSYWLGDCVLEGLDLEEESEKIYSLIKTWK